MRPKAVFFNIHPSPTFLVFMLQAAFVSCSHYFSLSPPFSLDYLVLKVQCGFSETLSFSSAMFLCSEVVLIPHLKLSALYLVMSP